MPVDYDGDRTATQAPSDPPGPDAQITVALLDDGDDVNASASEQKDKVVADYIDWMYNPHGNGDVDNRFLRRYRTVQDDTRWALDRIGFPAATIMNWQEMWGETVTLSGVQLAAFTGGNLRNWHCRSTDAGGKISTDFDSVKLALVLDAGDALNSYSWLHWNGVPALTNDLDLVIEASIYIQDDTVCEFVFGIAHDHLNAPLSTEGIYFVKTPGAGNWRCSSVGPSGTTNVALGGTATLGGFLNMRIEFRGANVNDTATKTAYFFVGGELVGTITTNFPAAAVGTRSLLFGAKNTTGASAAAHRLLVWSVNFACNWIPAVTT